MHFADQIFQQIQKGKSPICVGLDPHASQLPSFLIKKHQNITDAILEFNQGIIDAVKDVAVAIKPQFAFYEIYGSAGIKVLEETCQYVKENSDLIIIGDGKRNDIGSTATAYAEAYLGKNSPYFCDALTVTPYLGSDGIRPFVEKCDENGKGIFVLVKTSNPSAGEFQDLIVGEELMHEKVALAVANWGENSIGESGFSSIGAVVGATYPEEIKILREMMPAQIFLIPGYGAQGGTMEDIKPAFYKNKMGALVNSSRGILFAYQKSTEFSAENYKDAAYEAVLAMQKEMEILD